MADMDFKQLGSSAEYRSAPFWAWNGKMDPAEVRRQINVMHSMNMGGFFMHSRAGLATEYMSEEWFKAIRAGIDEAGKLGMEASLYDEDRWPSGAGGGMVTADRRYRIRFLELYGADEPISGRAEDVLTCYYYDVRQDADNTLLDYRQVKADDEIAGGCRRIKIIVRSAHDQPGFNNAAYLDTMNPEAVQAFIDFTHERYFAECGSDFGKKVPYFFTDEPNYLDQIDHCRRAWSDRLPELFKAEMQQDITGFLPEFFLKTTARFSRARYVYYRIMTGLLADTFMKMIGQWCEKHNIKFTGHMLREDTLSNQLFAIGAAMPHYEYMHMPGIDLLTEKWVTVNTVKQVASVAHQLGKKRVLSETYGCTGWDFSLAGHKALGDWQYALGVNYRCQHLYWYSMRGQAKRDYPASIGGQSPWCGVYAPLEEYFGRLSELLSNAESTAELLVVHPVESMWGCAGSYDKQLSYDPALDAAFDQLGNALVKAQVEFDYGDESLMAKYGSVKNGALAVGQALYRGVYLPEVLTLRGTTIELLREFCLAGGRVWYSGSIPQNIDGKADDDGVLTELYKHFIQLDSAVFADQLAAEFARYSIRDPQHGVADGLISCRKRINERTGLLFTANIGCALTGDILNMPPVRDRQQRWDDLQWSIEAAANEVVRELDLYTGELYEVDFAFENNRLIWHAGMEPLQSRCYITGCASALPALKRRQLSTDGTVVKLQESPATFSEKNMLVLDHACVKAGNEVIGENLYILEADIAIRARLGLPSRSGATLQPWKICNQDNGGIDFELEFSFECQTLPEKNLQLIIESPERFEIELNQVRQSSQSCGFWCDPALEMVELPTAALRCGVNTLKLRGRYSSDFAGLEAVALYGDFGVIDQNILTAPIVVYSGNSLDKMLMPFYSGNTFYNCTFELSEAACCVLNIPDWCGSALGVSWDNGAEQVLYSQPYRVESNCLSAGKHTLQICVYGHRRNACGPFYCQPEHGWIGPHEFMVRESGSKIVVPMGLTGPVELLLAK